MLVKRFLAGSFVYAFALALGITSGCGGSDENNPPPGGGKGGGGSGGRGGSSGSGAAGNMGSGGSSGRGGTSGSGGGGASGSAGSSGRGGTSGSGGGGTSGSGGSDAGSDVSSDGTTGTGGVDAGSDVSVDGADAAPDASDGAPSDAIADTGFDGPVCTVGEVSSEATATNLSLFGTPVYFNGGNPLPAGTYGVTYVEGCMKYGSGQGWTVNAYDPGCCNWYIIGETTSDKKIVPPGTAGYAVGSGAYADFEACENASRSAAPRTFVHSGGRLGIWLQDSPYTDNLAGENGRNPKWRLVRLGECLDGGFGDGGADATAD